MSMYKVDNCLARRYNVITMKLKVPAKITKIGNSRGIRLPRVLLQQSQLDQEVELEAAPGSITISAKQHVRRGWEKQFKKVNKRFGTDQMAQSWEAQSNEFDETDWKW